MISVSLENAYELDSVGPRDHSIQKFGMLLKGPYLVYIPRAVGRPSDQWRWTWMQSTPVGAERIPLGS